MKILKNKILISAMSGGIDSTVATILCKQQGYEIIGITFLNGHQDSNFIKKQRSRIKLLSDKIGLKQHIFLDLKNDFNNRVVYYYFSEYLEGKTPNPCVLCNSRIKFGTLLDYVTEKFGNLRMITGHYAKIHRLHNGLSILKRPVDYNKDQTYFLSMLTSSQIERAIMPLGVMHKEEVKNIAIKFGINKMIFGNDSQDFCLFQNQQGNFLTIIDKFLPGFHDKSFHGDVIYKDRKIGQHDGFFKFTIGQRKGLNISGCTPVYIKKIDSNKKTIHLIEESENLNCNKFVATNMNWIYFPYKSFTNCYIQIRYNQVPQKATVYKISDRYAIIKTVESLKFITPGQFVSVYKNDMLIAGGIIG